MTDARQASLRQAEGGSMSMMARGYVTRGHGPCQGEGPRKLGWHHSREPGAVWEARDEPGRAADVEAPGLQCADAVDEPRDLGLIMLDGVRDGMTRGIQLAVGAMALDAAMGQAGAVPTTLLLRRAAEASREAETYADPGILSRIDLGELWRDAWWITAAKLEVLGLSIDPVPPDGPISFEPAFERLTSTDITPAVPTTDRGCGGALQGAALGPVRSEEFRAFMASRGFRTSFADAAGFAAFMDRSDAAMGQALRDVGLAKG